MVNKFKKIYLYINSHPVPFAVGWTTSMLALGYWIVKWAVLLC